MHRSARFLILAGLMTATLHAQAPQAPPTAAPAMTPSVQARTPPPAIAAQTAPPAQTPPPAPASPRVTPPQIGSRTGTATPPAAPAAAPSRFPDPAQNIRVDLTITDGTGARNTDAAAVKVVTMLVADGRQGRIRSSNNIRVSDAESRQILINIDAVPNVRADGRIQLQLTVEYTPDLPQSTGSAPRPSSINESLTVLVTDGKRTLISQSADPATSRQVSVEVTATIVK
jgi:hypothetical protein